MARTAAFRSLARLMTAALLADHRTCSATDALESLRDKTQGQTGSSNRLFPLPNKRWTFPGYSTMNSVVMP
jgi:hypothetical protein